ELGDYIGRGQILPIEVDAAQFLLHFVSKSAFAPVINRENLAASGLDDVANPAVDFSYAVVLRGGFQDIDGFVLAESTWRVRQTGQLTHSLFLVGIKPGSIIRARFIESSIKAIHGLPYAVFENALGGICGAADQLIARIAVRKIRQEVIG